MENRIRLLVLSGLGLALILRLAFVLSRPDLPLYWDEVHYDAFGRAYAEAWAAIGSPPTFVARLRAAAEKGVQKGEPYSAMIGLAYAIGGVRPRALFLIQAVQAVIDALSCLLVYGIACRMGGRAVGVVALLLAAVYEPFIFAAARLQTETVCSFLLLASLWVLVTGASSSRLTRTAVAGALLALAMLVRPALQFLVLALMPLVGAVPRQTSWLRRLTVAAAFLGGFLLIIGPRMLLTYALLGRPVWSGTVEPSVNVYAGNVLENLGWKTDGLSFATPPRGELLAVLEAEASDAAEPSDADYRRAALLTWWNHPVGSAALVVHKVYQVWAHPYNDSRRRLLVGFRTQRLWHQLMLILAAVGLPLALRNWRAALLVVVTILYIWAVCLAVHIEVRYFVIAVPLMLCCAALAAVTLARGVSACWRAGQMRRPVVLATAVVGLAALLRFFPVGRLVELTELPAGALHSVRVAVMLAAAGLSAAVVGLLVRREAARPWAVVTALLPLALAVLLLLVGWPLANTWHRWRAPLLAGVAVRQDVTLPSDVQPPLRAELRIDLLGSSGDNDVVVSVNGEEMRRFAGGPSRDNAVLPPDYYFPIFDAQGLGRKPWRAWYAVPIPVERIVPSATLRVEARVDGSQKRGSPVMIFGDYAAPDETVYDGPSPFAPQLYGDTSIEKFLVDGDFRMRRRVTLRGSSHSSFSDGRDWSDADLSLERGRQYGRYRIVLLLTYAGQHVEAF